MSSSQAASNAAACKFSRGMILQRSYARSAERMRRKSAASASGRAAVGCATIAPANMNAARKCCCPWSIPRVGMCGYTGPAPSCNRCVTVNMKRLFGQHRAQMALALCWAMSQSLSKRGSRCLRSSRTHQPPDKPGLCSSGDALPAFARASRTLFHEEKTAARMAEELRPLGLP